jgi:hypothetical protein
MFGRFDVYRHAANLHLGEGNSEPTCPSHRLCERYFRDGESRFAGSCNKKTVPRNLYISQPGATQSARNGAVGLK